MWGEGAGVAFRVVWAPAAVLAIKARFDAEIAAAVADGWQPAADPPLQPLPAPEPPTRDLRQVVEPLMEALREFRWAFDRVDPSGRLRRRYEGFRCALQEAGFHVSGLERLDRARAERRLGELAESRGDRPRAIVHYRTALAGHPQVGVKRRLAALEADQRRCTAPRGVAAHEKPPKSGPTLSVTR